MANVEVGTRCLAAPGSGNPAVMESARRLSPPRGGRASLQAWIAQEEAEYELLRLRVRERGDNAASQLQPASVSMDAGDFPSAGTGSRRAVLPSAADSAVLRDRFPGDIARDTAYAQDSLRRRAVALPRDGGGRPLSRDQALLSEQAAKLAQKLGQFQPFTAVFPQRECMGQLASFGPT
jgi:hypothetical protein